MNLKDLPDLLTVKELTEYLRMEQSSIYKLVRSGDIKTTKIRGAYRVSKDNLVKYLDSVTN